MRDLAARLTPGCDRCAALCCIALDIDKGDAFPIDKPAGQRCPNLTATNQCAIHPDLKKRGYHGCIAFDCRGAGQLVTQELHSTPRGQLDATAPTVAHDFSRARQIQKLLELIYFAKRLPLSASEQRERDRLETILAPDAGFTRQSFDNLPLKEIDQQVHAFLAPLKRLAAPSRRA